jgi:hypothetical protein
LGTSGRKRRFWAILGCFGCNFLCMPCLERHIKAVAITSILDNPKYG